MRSRSLRLGAFATVVGALALLAPSIASANHFAYPVAGVGGAVIGHTTTPSIAAVSCVPAAKITASALTGKVKATATSHCRGTLGLRRAYIEVRIFQGNTQLGSTTICYWKEHADGTPYQPNMSYKCPTPSFSFVGVKVLRAETLQAYRLYSGSWIAAGHCKTPTYEGPTGAGCEVAVTTVG